MTLYKMMKDALTFIFIIVCYTFIMATVANTLFNEVTVVYTDMLYAFFHIWAENMAVYVPYVVGYL